MFIGFELNITRDFFQSRALYDLYVSSGRHHLDREKARYSKDLMSYVTNKEIDGTKIQDEWFPTVKADVFISHSHADEELACALAGWINDTFGLTCFIDSNVWGYSKELLAEMNNSLSNPREENGVCTYDHESCNQVAQHVDAMLSIALHKMIDKAEAVILLNTSNSIRVCNTTHMEKTYSPWIYSEIMCTQIVRKKPLLAYRDYSSSFSHVLERMQFAMQFSISYTVSLAHLRRLQQVDLQKWEEEYTNNQELYSLYPLDALYTYICPDEVKNTHGLFEVLEKKEVDCIKDFYSGRKVTLEEVGRLEGILNNVIRRDTRFCIECDKYYGVIQDGMEG